MKIQKAVITAAARNERLYPAATTVQKSMLPVIDIDGINKPLIQIIAEEALQSCNRALELKPGFVPALEIKLRIISEISRQARSSE